MPAPDAPVLDRVDPEEADTLTVKFDQIVGTGSVEDESNYLLRRVDDPLTTVAVTEAVRILDGCFVRLALERRLEVDVEYRLEALDILGECGLTADSLSAVVIVPGPAGDETPEPCIALSQNYPNPFNPVTWIEFTIPRTGQVSLVIFDVSGKRVRDLLEGTLPAGRHEFAWDGRGEDGSAAAAGVYFYRLRAAGESLTRKMVLLR
jgi:hypothetical protein